MNKNEVKDIIKVLAIFFVFLGILIMPFVASTYLVDNYIKDANK